MISEMSGWLGDRSDLLALRLNKCKLDFDEWQTTFKPKKFGALTRGYQLRAVWGKKGTLVGPHNATDMAVITNSCCLNPLIIYYLIQVKIPTFSEKNVLGSFPPSLPVLLGLVLLMLYFVCLLTWWLSTVCGQSHSFRPESLSLLRTVNTKIQQEWMITIVFLFSAAQAVFVVSPVFILLYCCSSSDLIKPLNDFWKIWFMLKPMLKTCHNNIFLLPSCVFFPPENPAL